MNPDLYTKSMLTRDLAELEHIRCGARQTLARREMTGFNNLNIIVANCDTAEKRCRAKYAENASTFGALRKSKHELSAAIRRGDGPEIKRLERKTRFLSMLVAQILDGTEKKVTFGTVDEVEVVETPMIRKQNGCYEMKLNAATPWVVTTLEAVRKIGSCLYV